MHPPTGLHSFQLDPLISLTLSIPIMFLRDRNVLKYLEFYLGCQYIFIEKGGPYYVGFGRDVKKRYMVGLSKRFHTSVGIRLRCSHRKNVLINLDFVATWRRRCNNNNNNNIQHLYSAL